MNYAQLALLGVGLGGAYALLSIGVVTIYRGTGVPNFAHGAVAMFSAFMFFNLRDDRDWATAPAMVATLVLGALIGIAFHFLVMRRLKDSPLLAKILATLALLTLLQGLAILWFDIVSGTPKSVLPQELVTIGSYHVVSDRLWLGAIAVVVGLVMGLVSQRTKLGLAIRAISENEKGAMLQGYSPNALSALTWGVGSALAALAGILVSPIAGLDANALALLIVPVFGAALLARFSSYLIAVAASFAIGAVQSILQAHTQPGEWWEWLYKGTGRAEAFPAFVIIVAMILSGKVIPSRGAISLGRMPLSPRPQHLVRYTVIGVALASLGLTMLSRSWVSALTATLIAATIALSLVVVTGFAGQISLGQMAFAGIAGVITARLTSDFDIPFPIPILISGLVAAVLGVLIGLPSLRVRGPSLAIVTLSAAWVCQRMIFQDTQVVGSDFPRVPAPSLFGTALDARQFGFFCLAVLVVMALIVSNLRKSRTGRRFLTVRENERAAAAAGVDVRTVKLQAFAISAFVAGLGGSLLAYQARVFAYERFSVFESLFLFVNAYIGGVGMVAGAIVAGIAVSGGVFAKLLNTWGAEDYHRIIAGAGLLISIQLHPDGLASTATVLRMHRRHKKIAQQTHDFEDEHAFLESGGEHPEEPASTETAPV
ncbi:MAG: hypothetical protein AB7L84_03175 [Acidimicrobiia bacterium]